MRFTSKKVEEVITRILHDDGLDLLKVLKGKENVSEFDIAKKMKRDIKVVRRMLYLLYNNNLVTFTRKKDKQKGWYVYYWTIDVAQVKFNYIKDKKELLLRMQGILEKEQKELFFVSPDGGVRLNFDDAMEYDFHCPETGELMQQDDNTQRIISLQARIKNTSKEILDWEKSERERMRAAAKRVEEERKKEEADEKKRVADEKKAKEDLKKKKADEKKKKSAEKKAAKKKAAELKKKEKMAKKKAAKKKSSKPVSSKKKTAVKKVKKPATEKKVVKKKKAVVKKAKKPVKKASSKKKTAITKKKKTVSKK
jgi:transcription initiation factor TFIIE subunit alpha